MFAQIVAFVGLFAAILTGTWNMKWFPSGRAEHRAPPAVEEAAIRAAGMTIHSGLLRSDASGAVTNAGVILFFQELRDGKVMSNLVVSVGVTNLKTACVSAFRDYDRRLMWQQCGIATTLPILDASWSYWKRPHRIIAPRGYAYAVLDGGPDGLIACWCVHLKSNYGATTAARRKSDREKREVAVEQLAALTKRLKAPDGRPVNRFIIAGDFNMDPYKRSFKSERTVSILADAGFVNCFNDAAEEDRATFPGSGRSGPSTLDFIFHRGFESQFGRFLAPESPVSDHRMLWLRLN